MRQVLVDYARRYRAGTGWRAAHLPAEEATLLLGGKDIGVVAPDDALKELAKIDVRKAQVAELCFFGACFSETAELLKCIRDHYIARLEHGSRLAAPPDWSWAW
jgi:hypothetical protein